MNSSPSPCSDPATIIKRLALGQGACRVGIAACRKVAPEAVLQYDDWLARHGHAGMAYMERYSDIRSNPHLLLPGAQSIVCCAWAYRPAPPCMGAPIAAYALGSDYHDVLRARLTLVVEAMKEQLGGEYRICVDTAPLRERYWAAQAGVGFIGRNGLLIAPGVGSYLLLGEIITTLPLSTDSPLEQDCGNCGRCVRSCPGGALLPAGGLDANRCLSYLTIEHRGDFPSGTDLHGRLYGCDGCQQVCPHNKNAAEQPVIPELMPRESVTSLTPEQCAAMTQEQFSLIFRGSPIKRAKLAGLRRNALALK